MASTRQMAERARSIALELEMDEEVRTAILAAVQHVVKRRK